MGKKLSRAEWAEFLERRNESGDWNLERVLALAEACGVRRKNHFIHVAGTNGKGSVCAMVERGLRELGVRTGLYTSPHLVSVYERIRIDGRSISGREFAEAYRRVRPLADAISARGPRYQLTFFEIFTVIGLLIFQEQLVDRAVVEVGLGGRLDATNIIEPDLTVITSISLDHEESLGASLTSIAREKAGILKPGVPLVLGPASAAAREEILTRARRLQIPVLEPTADTLSPRHLDGCEQLENGRIVAAIGDFYFSDLPESRDRFLRGAEKTRWIGRWQRCTMGNRTLILDSTHNVGGREFLRQNLQRLVEEMGRRPVILTATLGLTRARALMPLLAEFAEEIVLVDLENGRAVPPDLLRGCIPSAHGMPLADLQQRDLGRFFHAHPGNLFLVTGSIFLLGEVIRALSLWPRLV